MGEVRVIGGGPAGSAAALAALGEGCAVRLFERSAVTRHKVCGEFLSPEIAPMLERLGVWGAFQAHAPARLTRVVLRLGSREKRWQLAEPAFGLSRRVFDRLLLDAAVSRGATLVREAAHVTPGAVVAWGRAAAAPRGDRLFGFKAHFTGPADDAVQLFFASGCYIGFDTVEQGVTNVCGLAPEALLLARRFEIDALLAGFPAVGRRLEPLTRTIDWLVTGPLVFAPPASPTDGAYRAGDALGFIDPFTGSGNLMALWTGIQAGVAAARGQSIREYHARCRAALEKPYRTAAWLRTALASGIAGIAAPLVPGGMLYRFTRPSI